jgi:hypothetical protein
MNDQKKEIGEKVALLKKNHKIKKKDIEELSNNKLQLAALLGAEFDGKTLSEILTPFDPQHPA